MCKWTVRNSLHVCRSALFVNIQNKTGGKKRKIKPKKSLKRESEFRYWLACKILVGRSYHYIYNVVPTSSRAQFFVLDSLPPSSFSPSRHPLLLVDRTDRFSLFAPPQQHSFVRRLRRCIAFALLRQNYFLRTIVVVIIVIPTGTFVFGFFYRLRVSSTCVTHASASNAFLSPFYLIVFVCYLHACALLASRRRFAV